ncbi:YunG family protein [Sutcliffiella halmapala]
MNREMKKLSDALFASWSIDSSTKWTEGNPAKGQCGVSALVVNELYGGEILKTKLEEGWHFYNFIDGRRFDFTYSQFCHPIVYDDIVSSRAEALEDTNEEQFSYLLRRVWEEMEVIAYSTDNGKYKVYDF